MADRYELLEVVGTGGMGVVYRGRDRVLDRAVAVKMIRSELADDEFMRRFEREAAILARLRSPHILVIYDYGSDQGAFYLVTDFLADGDLAQWLADHGPMPAELAVRLVADLATGLADAHEHGVIHRDIKPGNVLLWRRAGQLHPVLGDFGIAVAEDLEITGTGGVIGSPLFMAPERHLGEPATVASDIYAMGCLLYNLLAGHPPYQGTGFQAAHAHVNEPIPALPAQVSGAAALDDVIASCLAKDPDDRIASAAELATRLRAAADRRAAETVRRDLVPPPPPPPPPPPHAPMRRRAPAVAVAVVALVLAGLGVTAWRLATQGDDEAPDEPASPTTSDVAVAPAAPGAVRAERSPVERAVAFDVSLPASPEGTRIVVERKDDQQWVSTEDEFTVATGAGGEPGCAVLRYVAVAGDLRTPGPEGRLCGRSAKARILLSRGEAGCVGEVDGYPGAPCVWINLTVTGLRPGATYHLTLLGESGRSEPTDITADADGRIVLVNGQRRDGTHRGGGFSVLATVETIDLTVAGRPSVHLRKAVADLR
ncbi:hypothetical protein CFH99_19555 [Nocardioides aromaticivorans]|uniref:Protein kinase domain-containing protein n=1 Tax=Nocardioides aromaticivorans TaxID=200618 RepID=A0ABX7PPB7_9ACTN|nr:serine/threonine-protein kinase [Nocardioides aromaticivorans]QSR27824.1 hypothetical protein CFH99_19555 [Nocardioides aromaticivorans]